eukprot:PhM_4_TR15978/c0_g1_i2/m.97951
MDNDNDNAQDQQGTGGGSSCDNTNTLSSEPTHCDHITSTLLNLFCEHLLLAQQIWVDVMVTNSATVAPPNPPTPETSFPQELISALFPQHTNNDHYYSNKYDAAVVFSRMLELCSMIVGPPNGYKNGGDDDDDGNDCDVVARASAMKHELETLKDEVGYLHESHIKLRETLSAMSGDAYVSGAIEKVNKVQEILRMEEIQLQQHAVDTHISIPQQRIVLSTVRGTVITSAMPQTEEKDINNISSPLWHDALCALVLSPGTDVSRVSDDEIHAGIEHLRSAVALSNVRNEMAPQYAQELCETFYPAGTRVDDIPNLVRELHHGLKHAAAVKTAAPMDILHDLLAQQERNGTRQMVPPEEGLLSLRERQQLEAELGSAEGNVRKLRDVLASEKSAYALRVKELENEIQSVNMQNADLRAEVHNMHVSYEKMYKQQGRCLEEQQRVTSLVAQYEDDIATLHRAMQCSEEALIQVRNELDDKCQELEALRAESDQRCRHTEQGLVRQHDAVMQQSDLEYQRLWASNEDLQQEIHMLNDRIQSTEQQWRERLAEIEQRHADRTQQYVHTVDELRSQLSTRSADCRTADRVREDAKTSVETVRRSLESNIKEERAAREQWEAAAASRSEEAASLRAQVRVLEDQLRASEDDKVEREETVLMLRAEVAGLKRAASARSQDEVTAVLESKARATAEVTQLRNELYRVSVALSADKEDHKQHVATLQHRIDVLTRQLHLVYEACEATLRPATALLDHPFKASASNSIALILPSTVMSDVGDIVGYVQHTLSHWMTQYHEAMTELSSARSSEQRSKALAADAANRAGELQRVLETQQDTTYRKFTTLAARSDAAATQYTRAEGTLSHVRAQVRILHSQLPVYEDAATVLHSAPMCEREDGQGVVLDRETLFRMGAVLSNIITVTRALDKLLAGGAS